METTATQEQPASINYHRHGSTTVSIIAAAIAITVLAIAGASLTAFFLCRRSNKCNSTKESSALEEGITASKNNNNKKKKSFSDHVGPRNPISSPGDTNKKKLVFF